MTIAELIALLSKYPATMKVKVFDSDRATHHDPVIEQIPEWVDDDNWITTTEDVLEIG